MARPKAVDSASRARIVAAAAKEFAARGYAGASVDRIARAARLNKAMIYYHFASKAALYRDILNDMFGAVHARVAAVAAAGADPADQIRAYVAAIAGEAQVRPHFPPIWLREIAEGGTHIDAATVAHVHGILAALRAILDEGTRSGRFRPINPLMLHAGIIAPLMFFFATQQVRTRLDRRGTLGSADMRIDTVVAHIQQLALAQLEGKVV
jgi:TetR/AcrR family transcriptional regulator